MTRTVPSTSEPIELGEDFLADPHTLYRVLRDERPVARAVTPLGLRVWLVTRHADAREALNDPRLSKDGGRFMELLDRHSVAPEKRMAFADSLAGHMLNSDPPDHTRLRKLVNRAFTVRAISRMRPRIEAIAGALADDIEARAAAGDGTVDLLDTFAFPLPMTVICELLGVPEGERDAFRRWSNTLLSAGDAQERGAAGAAMAEFLARLVANKAANPGDDMLSAIVQATTTRGIGSPRGRPHRWRSCCSSRGTRRR
jgi:cytochrome P450